ncbi:MAG: DUF2178 domain-containing protein [Microgenomates group bacterium]
MNTRQYHQIRKFTSVFIGAIVSISVVQNSYLLATVGVLTGMLFLVLVRAKAKVIVDEREKAVGEKAAQMTYGIFAPTIAIASFLIIMFSRGEFYYLEFLGMVLAYLALFLIALYALSYHFFNRKYGGGNDEE